MTITFPLAIPTKPTAKAVKIRPMSAAAISQSNFTFEEKVFEHPGQAWVIDVELPPMERPAAEAWVALGLSLNGPVGTFLMGDPASKLPRGTPLGSPVVDGAGQQMSKTLATRGWTPNAQGVLLTGDWVQLGSGAASRIYKVRQDVNADGTGKAVLDVWPRIRGDLTDGEGVTTSNCVGVWYLPEIPPWDIGEAKIYGLTFTAFEALRDL